MIMRVSRLLSSVKGKVASGRGAGCAPLSIGDIDRVAAAETGGQCRNAAKARRASPSREEHGQALAALVIVPVLSEQMR